MVENASRDGQAPEQLAIISLKNFEHRKEEIARQLHESATHLGFFYIVGARSSRPP